MLSVIRRILALLSTRERVKLYLQFALLIVLAFVDVLGIASILPFMAVVSDPTVIQTNRWLKQGYDYFGFQHLQTFLFFLGMVALCLLVFGNLFKAFYTWVSLKYDNQLNYNLARRLLASYMARPYEFFLNTNSAEMGKNVLSEASTVIAGILSPGMLILSNVLLCVFILVLLMIVDPFVAIAIGVVLGGIYGAIYLAVRRSLVRMGKEQVRANFMKFRATGEALSGIKDIKILGRERQFLHRFAVHAQRHAQHNTSVGAISQLPRYALETIAFGGILLIVLYSLKAEREVGHIVPLLSMYAFAGYRLMPALQQLFASFSQMRVALPALEMLYKDMNEGRMAADTNAILPDTQGLAPLPFKSRLELDNVTFQYQEAPEPSIRGLSLDIAPYSSIGLVGTTGSGKTTTVDLILGLLTPTSGRIKVDGVEIQG
jgi:ABC-type multidrug transport system fused ATPase/permease subunit